MDDRFERPSAQLEATVDGIETPPCTGELDDALCERLEGHAGHGDDSDQPGRLGAEQDRHAGPSGDGLGEQANYGDFFSQLFPPGPAELDRWRDIIAARPELAPAVSTEEAQTQSQLRGLADGLDAGLDRVERLRAGGNGVVPLQAAYAICLLIASLRARCLREQQFDQDANKREHIDYDLPRAA